MVMKKKSYKKRIFKKRIPKRVNYLPHDKAKTEKKFYDVVAVLDCNTTPAITLLNGLSTGTDVSSRIGNRINLKSVQVDCIVYSNTNINPAKTRFMLVYDKNPNGVLPVIGVSATSGILDNRLTTGAPFTSIDTQEFLNLANKDRYVVLMDKVITIEPQSLTTPFRKAFRKYKKISSYTQYSATTAGIATINQGALYFIAMGDVTGGATNEPLCSFSSRIRYTDE